MHRNSAVQKKRSRERGLQWKTVVVLMTVMIVVVCVIKSKGWKGESGTNYTTIGGRGGQQAKGCGRDINSVDS